MIPFFEETIRGLEKRKVDYSLEMVDHSNPIHPPRPKPAYAEVHRQRKKGELIEDVTKRDCEEAQNGVADEGADSFIRSPVLTTVKRSSTFFRIVKIVLTQIKKSSGILST